jgi:hypothetical protein
LACCDEIHKSRRGTLSSSTFALMQSGRMCGLDLRYGVSIVQAERIGKVKYFPYRTRNA